MTRLREAARAPGRDPRPSRSRCSTRRRAALAPYREAGIDRVLLEVPDASRDDILRARQECTAGGDPGLKALLLKHDLQDRSIVGARSFRKLVPLFDHALKPFKYSMIAQRSASLRLVPNSWPPLPLPLALFGSVTKVPFLEGD